MTCERFITARHFVTCMKGEMVTRTFMVNMEITTIAMADGSDVKICW
jgi:hypothetical protein